MQCKHSLELKVFYKVQTTKLVNTYYFDIYQRIILK